MIEGDLDEAAPTFPDDDLLLTLDSGRFTRAHLRTSTTRSATRGRDERGHRDRAEPLDGEPRRRPDARAEDERPSRRSVSALGRKLPEAMLDAANEDDRDPPVPTAELHALQRDLRAGLARGFRRGVQVFDT